MDAIQNFLPLMGPGSLIVAHNMRYRPTAPEYIKAITANPALETIFLNTAGAGLRCNTEEAIAGKPPAGQQRQI